MTDIQYGDKVILNDKYYVSEPNKGKVFTVISDPYECCGSMVVKLDGIVSCYAVDGLSIVEKREALKPCPFCGGEAKFHTDRVKESEVEGVDFLLIIRCDKCGISSPRLYRVMCRINGDGNFDTPFDERQKAIAEWNRRTNNDL